MLTSKRAYRAIYDPRYETRGAVGDACTYCGVVSSGFDHVPPIIMLQTLSDADIDHRHCIKVPACAECNSILGDTLVLSIAERRKYVRDRLRKRYAKFLRIPRWDEDELSELDPDFAEYVRRSSALADHIRQRLAWRR